MNITKELNNSCKTCDGNVKKLRRAFIAILEALPREQVIDILKKKKVIKIGIMEGKDGCYREINVLRNKFSMTPPN